MFKIFVTVDKNQRVKYQPNDIYQAWNEHSFSNAESSFVSNFKTAGYFF